MGPNDRHVCSHILEGVWVLHLQARLCLIKSMWRWSNCWNRLDGRSTWLPSRSRTWAREWCLQRWAQQREWTRLDKTPSRKACLLCFSKCRPLVSLSAHSCTLFASMHQAYKYTYWACWGPRREEKHWIMVLRMWPQSDFALDIS